jgi:methylated-DNA-[protein]-cysteine S-methyltransferase
MAHHAATVCIETGFGYLVVEASERGVTRVRLNGKARPREVGEGAALKMAHRAAMEIVHYLCGEGQRFTAPIDLHGTAFQCAVWRELLTIPNGQTRSYGEVARRLRKPRSARAVGAACRANPLLILVPCHRVIARDGSLNDFQGGVQLKGRLLALERSGAREPAAEVAQT